MFQVFMFPLSNHYYRPIHKLLTIGNYTLRFVANPLKTTPPTITNHPFAAESAG